MVLKFKDPSKHDLKKIIVYGLDGTGKSTFAANYCKEHKLNPVVIDIEDTNRTNLFFEGKVLQLNLKNDIAAFGQVKKAIEEIKDSEFDTIIFDGVTTYLEMLTSNAKGIAKYSDRAIRFQKILQALLDSGKNIIFIGQIDMEVVYNDESQSSKAVIKVNALVNEKYLCYINDKGEFDYEIKKYRVMDNKGSDDTVDVKGTDVEVPDVEVDEIETSDATLDIFDDDPIRGSCMQIKVMLENEKIPVTKSNMRSKAIKLIKEGILPEENRPALIGYINKHCPEELQ